MTKSKGFISSITGLRAIAIIAVLINHIDTHYLPSGFLGVDLFFVISGFVVSLSLDKMQTKSIKNYLVEFYCRRAKRLFPALFVSILVVFLVGTVIEIGKITGRTGASALVGLSNFYLIHTGSSYFGLGSQYNFFLPTWSLAVEEQFYLFFPIFLFILKVKNKSIIKWSLPVILMSLSIFIFLYFIDKNYQFYLPISRLWEFLLGSITFFFTKRNQIYGVIAKYNAWLIAILLLGMCSVFILPAKYFLFSVPILCCFASLLLLLLSKYPSQFLTNPILMCIGSISYSIYLYHWPILKILNFGVIWPFNIIENIIVVLIIFSIASISYYCIENPLRTSNWIQLRFRNLLAFSFIAIFTSACSFLHTNHNIKNDPFIFPYQDYYPINQCDLNADKWSAKCMLTSKNSPRVFFIGDSHSRMLVTVMLNLFNKDHYQVYSLGTNGLFTTSMSSLTGRPFDKSSKKAFRFILDHARKGSTVVLSNQFTTWFSKTFNDDPRAHQLTYQGKLLSQEEAMQRYIIDIKNFAQKLKELDTKLVIIGPFPDFPNHPIKCYSPILQIFGINNSFNHYKNCITTRQIQDSRRKQIIKTLNILARSNSNITIFDPINLICNKKTCSSYKNGLPLYLDDDHVNYNVCPAVYGKINYLIKNS